jgi:alpha-tubulin suppressor-like RCC1 family protein
MSNINTIIVAKQDGSVWATGANGNGMLGTGNTIALTVWTKLSITNVKQIVYTNGASIAIKNDGTMWSAGHATLTGINAAPGTATYAWTKIGTDTNWAYVAIGDNHAMAIKTDGTMYGWGSQTSYKAVGLPSAIIYYVPTKIGTATDWKQVTCGNGFSCAIKNDGTMYVTGFNDRGQLGTGNVTAVATFTKVGTDTWNKVSASQQSVLIGIKTTGTLWGAGYYYPAIIGVTDTNDHNTFIQSTDVSTTWLDIDAGYNQALGLKTDNTLWAWGQGSQGQLGQGNASLSRVPIKVGLDTDWTHILSGPSTTYALKNDGRLYGAGYNNVYQLGTGNVTAFNTFTNINQNVILLNGQISLAETSFNYEETLTNDFTTGTLTNLTAINDGLTLKNTPVVSNGVTTSNSSYWTGNYYAWEFKVGVNNISVKGLRWGTCSNYSSRIVYLWDVDTQTQLASLTVTGSAGGWLTANLATPITLLANKNYVLSANQAGVNVTSSITRSNTFSSAITWVQGRTATGTGFPTQQQGINYECIGVPDIIINNPVYNTSGNRVLPDIDISDMLIKNSSNAISWDADVPTNTTLTIQTSVDGGSSWQTCTNGQPIPNLVNATNVIKVKQLFTTTVTSVTPTLQNLSITNLTGSTVIDIIVNGIVVSSTTDTINPTINIDVNLEPVLEITSTYVDSPIVTTTQNVETIQFISYASTISNDPSITSETNINVDLLLVNSNTNTITPLVSCGVDVNIGLLIADSTSDSINPTIDTTQNLEVNATITSSSSDSINPIIQAQTNTEVTSVLTSSNTNTIVPVVFIGINKIITIVNPLDATSSAKVVQVTATKTVNVGSIIITSNTDAKVPLITENMVIAIVEASKVTSNSSAKTSKFSSDKRWLSWKSNPFSNMNAIEDISVDKLNGEVHAVSIDGYSYVYLEGLGVSHAILNLNRTKIARNNFGDIYTAGNDGYLRKAYDWSYYFGGSIYDIATDNYRNVYVSDPDGITKISPTGTKLWVYSFKSDNVNVNLILTIAVDKDNFVYIGDEKGLITKISPSGNKVWTFDYATQFKFIKALDVDDNGNVYAGCSDYTLIKINNVGQEVWRLNDFSSFYYSNPISVYGENIYISGSSTLVKISPTGSIIWTYNVPSGSIKSLDQDTRGNVVFGTNYGEIYNIVDPNFIPLPNTIRYVATVNSTATSKIPAVLISKNAIIEPLVVTSTTEAKNAICEAGYVIINTQIATSNTNAINPDCFIEQKPFNYVETTTEDFASGTLTNVLAINDQLTLAIRSEVTHGILTASGLSGVSNNITSGWEFRVKTDNIVVRGLSWDSQIGVSSKVVYLWDASTRDLLGSLTVTGEPNRQLTANFETPITLLANHSYVVSAYGGNELTSLVSAGVGNVNPLLTFVRFRDAVGNVDTFLTNTASICYGLPDIIIEQTRYFTPGTRIKDIDISSVFNKNVTGHTIVWNAIKPAETDLIIETSVDNGGTWQVATNGSQVPNLTNETTIIKVRETLSCNIAITKIATPVLLDLSILNISITPPIFVSLPLTTSTTDSIDSIVLVDSIISAKKATSTSVAVVIEVGSFINVNTNKVNSNATSKNPIVIASKNIEITSQLITSDTLSRDLTLFTVTKITNTIINSSNASITPIVTTIGNVSSALALMTSITTSKNPIVSAIMNTAVNISIEDTTTEVKNPTVVAIRNVDITPLKISLNSISINPIPHVDTETIINVASSNALGINGQVNTASNTNIQTILADSSVEARLPFVKLNGKMLVYSTIADPSNTYAIEPGIGVQAKFGVNVVESNTQSIEPQISTTRSANIVNTVIISNVEVKNVEILPVINLEIPLNVTTAQSDAPVSSVSILYYQLAGTFTMPININYKEVAVLPTNIKQTTRITVIEKATVVYKSYTDIKLTNKIIRNIPIKISLVRWK